MKSRAERILVLIAGWSFILLGSVGWFSVCPAGRAVCSGRVNHPLFGICVGPSPAGEIERAVSQDRLCCRGGCRQDCDMVAAPFSRRKAAYTCGLISGERPVLPWVP